MPTQPNELADLCESADGPSRELDELIAAAHAGAVREVQSDGRTAYHTETRWVYVEVKPYTASIDAALTLVPEGWAASVLRWSGGEGKVGLWKEYSKSAECPSAATPALALCAAALRANGGEHGR